MKQELRHDLLDDLIGWIRVVPNVAAVNESDVLSRNVSQSGRAAARDKILTFANEHNA